MSPTLFRDREVDRAIKERDEARVRLEMATRALEAETKRKDQARAIARRLRDPNDATASDAFDALPWAKDDA